MEFRRVLFRSARGLSIRDISPAEASRRPPERSSGCYVITSGGAVEVSASARHSLAETLAAVVDAYKTTNRIYRAMSADLEALSEEYGSVAAVGVFPAFTNRDILEISRAPVKLPAGITP